MASSDASGGGENTAWEKPEPFNASKALNETPRTKEGAVTLYDAWAPSYDQTLVGWGYDGPACTTALLTQYCQQPETLATAALLDCGCGTGLVAEALQAAGITGPRTGTGPSAT